MNPFFLDDMWFCEYCGKLLETDEEAAESACRECLDYFEAGPVECGGCYDVLPSHAHRELGWCNDCGLDIYGGSWPDMLRQTTESREWGALRSRF